MKSYSTARSYFDFLSFIAWLAIISGGILAFIAGGTTAEFSASLMPIFLSTIPGISLVIVGLFGLIFSQTSRATVDSAEYAQQSLQLSREQFEISKQLLAHVKGAAGAAGYEDAVKAEGLKDVSYDTDLPKDAVAASAQPGIVQHHYSGKVILQQGNEYLVEGSTFYSLADAQMAIDGTKFVSSS